MEKMPIFSAYFIFRMLINIASMIILVRFVYYNTYKKKDPFFTFFLLNFIVFLLAYLLENTGGFSSLGSAFGLLAAFSLLRFRTDTISMKDMTYLFIVMTFGLINSIMKASYLEITALNVIIIAAVFVVDGNWFIRNQSIKTIEYPSLENIKPDKQNLLIAELKERTGLDINRISIDNIDIGKGRATIKIYYYDSQTIKERLGTKLINK